MTIISFRADDQQFVAVANRVFRSNKWKTFPDFLYDYIKQALGPAWGNTEIAKPLSERHPILQWYVDSVDPRKRRSKRLVLYT